MSRFIKKASLLACVIILAAATAAKADDAKGFLESIHKHTTIYLICKEPAQRLSITILKQSKQPCLPKFPSNCRNAPVVLA